jgi:chromosomal replication initiator protein
MNAEHAWQATLGQLQLEMSKAAFDTWVSSAEFLGYDEETHCFEIGVKNAYARDWLDDRLGATIARLLTGMLGNPVTTQFKVWNAKPHQDKTTLAPAPSPPTCRQ